MGVGLIILLLIVYCCFEFVNSLFFNWRLMLLSEKKFITAGLFAAVSTVLLVSSVIVASWVASDGSGASTDIVWWIIPFVAISMGIGNFLAALLVPVIRRKLENRRVVKRDNKINSENKVD